MDALRAHSVFALYSKERRVEILDYDISLDLPLGEADCWPAAATAAVALAGHLDDAVTEADLDEGVAHFLSLYRSGVIDAERWSWETAGIVEQVCQWCAEQEAAA